MEKMEKIPIDEVKLNDFFARGRYTYIVALLLTVVFLNQLGNGLFMMFGGRKKQKNEGFILGASPKIASCGDHDFSDAVDIIDSCLKLKEVLKTENCTPTFSYEFRSVNIDVSPFLDSRVLLAYKLHRFKPKIAFLTVKLSTFWI